MPRYKPYESGQGYFISLEPSEHFSEYSLERVIDRFVEEHVDIRLFEKGYENDEKGQRAIHPFLKLKVILYSFARGIHASRKIEEMIGNSHLGYMYLSANTLMDHSTLCNFINEFNGEIEEVFAKLLMVMDELDLVDWDIIMIDGTRISSAADKELTSDRKGFRKKYERYRKLSEKIVQRAKRVDEEEQAGKRAASESNRESERIKRQKEYYERIMSKIKKYEQEVEEGIIDEKEKVNLTDRESRLLKDKEHFVQGYNVQAAISGNDIIVDVDALSKSSDQGIIEERVNRVEDVKRELGVETESKYELDKGYCMPEQIVNLTDEGKDVYCAIPESGKTGWIHDNDYAVVCEGEQVYFTCMGGVRQKGYYEGKKDKYIFTVKKEQCAHCENKEKCWGGRDGTRRKFTVSRTFVEKKDEWHAYIKKMESPDGQYIYNKRIGKEHNFRDLKYHNGLQRILRRGREKAKTEAILAAIAHNLKKMAKGLMLRECMSC